MKLLNDILKFCRYLFWTQRTDKSRYDSNDDLKKSITTIIGQEISEGRTEPLSPLYISRMLNIPLAEVETAMNEMGIKKRGH